MEEMTPTMQAQRERKAVVCHDGVRRNGIAAALELEDVTVAAEADLSSHAFRVVSVTDPDLVVLDLTVAGASGLAMVPRLRASTSASIVAVAPAWMLDAVAPAAHKVEVDVIDLRDLDGMRAAVRP